MTGTEPITLRLSFKEYQSSSFELRFQPDESDGVGLWIGLQLKWLANNVELKAYVEYKCLESFRVEVERFFKGEDVEARLYDTDCSFAAHFVLGPSRRDVQVSLSIQSHGCEARPCIALRVTDAEVGIADVNDLVQGVSHWLAVR